MSPRHDFTAAWTRLLQWRLLCVWVLALLIPTLAVQLPLAAWLGELLGFSPRADEMARRLDALMIADVGYAWAAGSASPLRGAATMALLLSLLISPFLAGVMVTAARPNEGPPPRLVPLLTGGLTYYFRMFRLWLVSLVPLALVGGLAAGASKIAEKRAERATLLAEAERAQYLALAVALVLFLLVRATIEAGRALMASDDSLRSGWRAWLRGVRVTVRRPLAVLGRYFGLTALTLAAVSAILLLRLRINGATAPLFALGFLVTQLSVALLGWGRAARLASLVSLLRR